MKTRNPELRSILAESIATFVQYKRALNRKYRAEALALNLFDRYLCERQVRTWAEINQAMVDDFLSSRPRNRPRSYNHLRGVLARFFEWAILHKLTQHNPVITRPRRVTSQRIPYLFDLPTAQRLLEIARTLPDGPKAAHRGLVYETIFALLYGLGLRVSEVAKLRLGDVDFVRNTLLIRETKFQKSRYVPFGPRLAQRVRRYVEELHGQGGEADVPLFSFTERSCISAGTISLTFHQLVPRLQLHMPPGVSPPRVHDLRHSFATGTLLRWYREGIDPNQRLVHLSTFMGHCNPASTAIYLTITEEMLQQAGERFHVSVPKEGVL
ncbi:integrase [Burkholderia sp. Bp8963]|uniref:tyrosine-type recombinase/integrase n=1 Tax=Burkholderia sp. Bp8963 TaxID=2184547 RepID=UPI000F5AC794|nr:tyrosine-type recombinase/integrase [Burkholderia sp. Bp8963]RQS68130.1 integrase [Burkholderia sp. Bp8963]